MRTLTFAVLLLFAAGSAFAQSNDVKSLNVTMNLSAPTSCAITVDSDLSLSGTLPSSGSATFTADPTSGSFSASAGSIDEANSALGEFSVNVSSPATLNLIAPPTLVSSNGDAISFAVSWAMNNGSTYQAISGNSTTLQSGTHSFRVGGTITANANVQAGTYTSSIDIAVSCNN